MTYERAAFDPPRVPRWLHAWAIATACAALPLVVLGAEVTTKQVGMADPQSVREPWYLFTIPWSEFFARGIGYVIEHSHRTAGWLVGILAIVLAIGSATAVRKHPARWLGVLALVMVGVQGVLGIFRVKLNALAGTDLALVHGLFAQLVIATLAAMVIVTSRAWRRLDTPVPAVVRRWAFVVLAALLVQAVFGALVRHYHSGVGQRLHVLFAFAVVVAIYQLWRAAGRKPAGSDGDRGLRVAASLLVWLVVLQTALGVEAWIQRFGAGVPVVMQPGGSKLDLIRSGHYLVASLLIATATAVAVLVCRPVVAALSASEQARQPAAEWQSPAVPVGGAL
jgi:heme A synthase